MLEIPRELGSQKLKLLKESMKLNWNFQRGGVGVSKQKLFMGEGVWIFLEQHIKLIFIDLQLMNRTSLMGDWQFSTGTYLPTVPI